MSQSLWSRWFSPKKSRETTGVNLANRGGQEI